MEHAPSPMNAMDALQRLMDGNRAYTEATRANADISLALREKTCANGQHPFAIVITCSDSRVVPDHIFMVDLASLFVIRVAGNVVGPMQLGSVVYAANHLGTRLALVMGHTHCGAIEATFAGDTHGNARVITDQISRAIGEERDDEQASILNVRYTVDLLKREPEIAEMIAHDDFVVRGALYHIDNGQVELVD